MRRTAPVDSSTLSRLIQAGRLAGAAAAAALLDRGLLAADDPLLLALGACPRTEADLARDLGIENVCARLDVLIERGLAGRQAVGPELAPGIALTTEGEALHKLLLAHRRELEEALLGELAPKRRKQLRRTLKRFVSLLRL